MDTHKNTIRCWPIGIPLLMVILSSGCGRSVASSTNSPENSARIATPRETATAVEVRADWPNLFGPQYNSVVMERGLALNWSSTGPKELWRHELGEGYSAPAVAEERLIALYRKGTNEIIECLDAATGEHKWSLEYPTTYRCPSDYSHGPYSSPSIAQGRVYAVGAEGQFHCLDLATGEIYWQRNILTDFQVKPNPYAVTCSPLVFEEQVILNVGGKESGAGIVAFNPRTGDTVWTATNDTASYASPVAATIHGQPFVFVQSQEHLTSLDPRTGKVHWQIPFQPKSREFVVASSPVVHGDLVFASAYMVGCVALKILPNGGFEEVWREGPRTLSNQYCNMVCLDGHVYAFTALDRSLRCLKLDEVRQCWSWPSEFGRGAMSVAVDNHLIMIGELGHLGLIGVNPTQPELKYKSREPILSKPCFTQPALANGRLYLRNEQTLVCLDLRMSSAQPKTLVSVAMPELLGRAK